MYSEEELKHKFNFHAPKDEGVKETHEKVRTTCLDTARDLELYMPECEEKKLAISKLEEAMFWANAGVARFS